MSNSEQNRITLERESNEQTRKLKKSIKKVKWSRSLMQIFWTAGPVTTLGLIGGYYIGYGTMPSLQLLIYFVSFTVFSGIIGLIAKVVSDGTREHLEEQAEQDVLTVTDTLGDLILIARDNVVQSYEGEARQSEAALQLLRRIDLTPYGVSIAFTDLTGDHKIGEIMGRIFAYRRIGLQSKVRELYTAYQDQINEIAEKMETNSPQAARELKLWFSGHKSGNLKYGVKREKYFLQRVMSAIENNNPYIMTFRDVEEMMILAFELINGREIPTLIFNYPGNWKYASALDEVGKKRSLYRVAQAKGGNRLRALSSYLKESGFVDPGELPEGLEINELAQNVTDVMDRFTAEAYRAVQNQQIRGNEIQRIMKTLKNCLELYEMAFNGYKESLKRHSDLIRATEKWEKMIDQVEDSSWMITFGSRRRGIRIKENVISLNEEQRLEVCKHLIWYFEKEEAKLKSSFLTALSNDEGMAARRLAIEIAVALEPHIKISKPEIQRNINATKAIYLGGLSPDMSSIQKQELGQRMAREVDNGLGLAAIRLADTLVHQYSVTLDTEALEFLHYNYNAPLKSLERVVIRKDQESLNKQGKHAMPPALSELKPVWKKRLQEIRKKASN